MLNIILIEKDDKDNGFWKMSTHPDDWKAIVDALKDKDTAILTQEHADH